MKKSLIIALLLCACFSLNISAQTTTESDSIASKLSPEDTKNFMLFRYKNRCWFIKLDTRSGVMTYVTWNNSKFVDNPLYPTPLVPESEQIPGRFTLILWDNLNTFYDDYILLDQVSGKHWIVSDLIKIAGT